MEDQEIIGLYWNREERAILETDRKYGGFCHDLALVIGTLAFDWEPNDTEAQAPWTPHTCPTQGRCFQ